ncbi:MAG: hypothetical protein HWE07_02615 [Cytophagia bacterium]|nr:hypothetical protein [Cytophagia bacterium]
MIKSKNSVEVLGTVNTVDFERVMNQFSSSFTESFLKVMESQFGLGIESEKVEEVKTVVVKPKSKPKTTTSKSKTKNSGFEKLKNPILRTELEKCKSVNYDETKFITIKELGIKSIYDLEKRSKRFWSDYFSKYGVYLRKGVNTSKISQKILFDRGIVELLNSGKSEPKSSDSTLPQ